MNIWIAILGGLIMLIIPLAVALAGDDSMPEWYRKEMEEKKHEVTQ